MSWTIEGQFDDEIGVIILDERGLRICEVEPYTEEWTEEEISTVRLIVAAPDLAEGLKAAGDAIVSLVAAIRALPEGYYPACLTIRTVAAALASAETATSKSAAALAKLEEK